MRAIFAVIATFYFLNFSAQSDLKFDKRFVQSEDQWVAFPADSLGNYPYGFIYIDSQAGLTLDYSGNFIVDKNGKFIAEASEEQTSMKVRLEPNNRLVAFLPEQRLKELNLKRIPEWLEVYKRDLNTIERLYHWGYMYNGWNECERALEFLEQAKVINPDFSGLRVELAFSYNCLKRYSEAIAILKKALLANPTDAYTHKELIFAQAHNGQLADAEKSYRKAVSKCPEKVYNAENAYNILQAYYLKKDVKKFSNWFTEMTSVFATSEQFDKLAKKMKAELEQ